MAQTDARAKRDRQLVSKLTDPNNVARPEIAHHRAGPPTSGEPGLGAGTRDGGSQASAQTKPGDQATSSNEAQPGPSASRKRKVSITEIPDSDSEMASHVASARSPEGAMAVPGSTSSSSGRSESVTEGQKSRKKQKASNSDSAGDQDIQMIDIDEETPPPKHAATRDIETFFSRSFPKPDNADKSMRTCLKCLSKNTTKSLVNESSTLRRHLAAFHEGEYLKWCTENDFVSMLEKHIKARKANKKAKSESQARLDEHLRPLPQKKRIVPYSDGLFNEAARQWLIETDQPLQALQHPAFKNMIDIAARAVDGVQIDNVRNTRAAIIELFKKNLTNIRARLKSGAVQGRVNLTCDAWQADTADGYFAVTGHWIEQQKGGTWKLQSALLGFVRMNCSHNGEHLGLALFKIVCRLEIEHKVGYVTCDNAPNNDTMMDHFGAHVKTKTNAPFDGRSHRVRCLAHIINLATQALLEKYSQSKHYNPHDPDQELYDTAAGRRDVIGLVRSIVVKARSSSQRKQLMLDLQTKAGVAHPRQLLLDMKVRWSSTYVMMHRAYKLREYVDQFIAEIAQREKSDREKRQKLQDLQLSEEEWKRVKLCVTLLSHSDDAQQAFSSEEGPALHLALPALEALQRAWLSCANRTKYFEFTPALEAGCAKIKEYFEKTADSHVYTFAQLLDPSSKTEYIKTSWGEELLENVLEEAEEIYKARYIEMYGATPGTQSKPGPSTTKGRSGASRKLNRLLGNLSDDPDSDDEAPPAIDSSSATPSESDAKPWLRDFHSYINSKDTLGNLSIIEWWGCPSTAERYPVWVSLAWDYLSIMAGSVSSERAFSSAGITISKRRNRLKADIVEALQCLKSLAHGDLLFQEMPSSLLEVAPESPDVPPSAAPPDGAAPEAVGWDTGVLGLDEEDDRDECRDEDEDVYMMSF